MWAALFFYDWRKISLLWRYFSSSSSSDNSPGMASTEMINDHVSNWSLEKIFLVHERSFGGENLLEKKEKKFVQTH